MSWFLNYHSEPDSEFSEAALLGVGKALYVVGGNHATASILVKQRDNREIIFSLWLLVNDPQRRARMGRRTQYHSSRTAFLALRKCENVSPAGHGQDLCGIYAALRADDTRPQPARPAIHRRASQAARLSAPPYDPIHIKDTTIVNGFIPPSGISPPEQAER
jgi:hypothetical protein